MLFFFILVGVQIIFESFPISSSGHLILLENILNYFQQSNYISLSNDLIIEHFFHVPTALVVALFFFDRWAFLLFHIRRCWNIILKLMFFSLVADFITFLFFILFKKVIDRSFLPLGLGFLISIILLFSLRFCNKKTYSKLTLGKVIVIGIAQGISLLPGISRFGLTFVTACWIGISPIKAFEFSFAIEWPLIVARFLEGLISFKKMPLFLQTNILSFNLLSTIIVSTIIAFFALCFVKKLILQNRLWIFSIFLCFSFFSWLFFICFF